MVRSMLILLGCLSLLFGIASAQQIVMPDFPLGIAGSIDPDFFKPYASQLQAMADTLHKYPLAKAIVTGGADGERFRREHDARNPGLALGRAHVLRNLLIEHYKVDSTQILIQSEDIQIQGPEHRYASIRISRELADLEARLAAIEQRPPVEKHFTEVRTEVPSAPSSPFEDFGLQFGLGMTTSPFGGTPMIAAAATWKRAVFVEAFAGHTFWNGSYLWQGTELNTKRRIIGGQIIVYPFKHLPVGAVGGWARVEEVSQEYYEYVKLSEGPQIGVRATPIKYLSATLVYNPTKHRRAGLEFSNFKNDQFLFSVMAHIGFGGAK